MTNREEIDQLAGEYVLGTLNAEERLAVETRRLQDAALEAAIHDWTQRMAPLQEEVSSAEPDPHLFDRIQARLDQLEGQGGTGGDRNGGTVLSLQKHVSRWRSATLVTGAIAASLFAYILVNAPLVQGPQQETFVAVFQSDDQQPAFLLSIDLKTRALTIQPVAAERQQQASYQLWIVGDGIGHNDTRFVQPHMPLCRAFLTRGAAKQHCLLVPRRQGRAFAHEGPQFGHLGQNHGHDFRRVNFVGRECPGLF